jgi:uncharacterized membrane protein YagU involved in acid resistance
VTVGFTRSSNGTGAGRRKLRDLVVGLVAGLVAGLVGSWAMNQVGPALEQFRQARHQVIVAGNGGESQPEGSGGQGASKDGGEESATVKVARIVSRTTLGRDVPEGSEVLAGNVVHFVFGGLTGAGYGAMAEVWPVITRGRGLLFGTLVWAAADEAALPLLGLSGPPSRYPLSRHLEGLTAHFVYGVTTDFVRRLIRRSVS